jgi:histidinol dehydrogenase
METVILPPKSLWEDLCRRPSIEKSDLAGKVRTILDSVRSGGDDALYSFSEKFDGIRPESLTVSQEEIEMSEKQVPDKLKSAINTAIENIRKFHSSQLREEDTVETTKGVRCWRKSVAVEKAGLYIPGGSAPLFSTVLMLGVPARLAGCSRIIICTPPDNLGMINPVILYAAKATGLTEIFRAGGAQAIAAMAYGTETIPRVSKIFGPGNQFVTMAKELVQQEGIAIDMPAGPSEVLVISDGLADPAFIAADLLSQAEHGPDSQVIYVTDDSSIIGKVEKEIDLQMKSLPRRDIASKALGNSRLIQLSSIGDCVEFSNMYAPEHLIINTSSPMEAASMITNAGSVFLGPYSCESAGDYASGTNHTLPTNGYARNYSGVSVDSFMKKITFQELSEEGIRNLGPVIEVMAEAESLNAHKKAVSIRLKSLDND